MANFEEQSDKMKSILLTKIMKQQFWLKSEADISYQCYFEKMDEEQFFQKYLWDFLGIKWEDLKRFI